MAFDRGIFGDRVMLEGEYGENRTWIDATSVPAGVEVTLEPNRHDTAACHFGREELDQFIAELITARSLRYDHEVSVI